MGLGDWVMASEDAKYYNELHGLRVVFANEFKRVSYNYDVFKNNPRVTDSPEPGEQVVRISNYAGHRPYISDVCEERFTWNFKFKAKPGELWLDDQEKRIGIEDAVIIEPYVKDHHVFSQNKAWGLENWKALVKSLDVNWVQLGAPDRRALPGVRKINTRRFREAIPYLNKAKLVVTTDGGMHHTRAALGKDAVVLWGGLVPPTILGSDLHKNIWHGAEPCGNRSLCGHCQEAMDSITVEEVKAAIEERLNRTDPLQREAEAAWARG
jgi:ADP-heptose:LPS heptosyltransferase